MFFSNALRDDAMPHTGDDTTSRDAVEPATPSSSYDKWRRTNRNEKSSRAAAIAANSKNATLATSSDGTPMLAAVGDNNEEAATAS